MNIVAICLHSLDMRDFYSELRDTPFLDQLRKRSIFVPTARAQGHHQSDSLNAEMTGVWTARHSNSVLTKDGYLPPTEYSLTPTLIEILQSHEFEMHTAIGHQAKHRLGTWAVNGGMKNLWLRDEPSRMSQFLLPGPTSRHEWLRAVSSADRFYAHIFLRETHRPWAQTPELYRLLGPQYYVWLRYRKKRGLPVHFPYDAYIARRAAIEQPNAFAELRRRGLAMADRFVEEVFSTIGHRDDTAVVVYSNHGEVLDHFRYYQEYPSRREGRLRMVEATSHGPFPYEVLYASMQMWMIPGQAPKVMRGIGRLVDFAPTVLDLAGAEVAVADGESMLPYFGEGVFPQRVRFAESPFRGGCLSMVREDGAKVVALGEDPDGAGLRSFEEHRLAVFDLSTDPSEYCNLVDTAFGRDAVDWAIHTHNQLERPAS